MIKERKFKEVPISGYCVNLRWREKIDDQIVRFVMSDLDLRGPPKACLIMELQ